MNAKALCILLAIGHFPAITMDCNAVYSKKIEVAVIGGGLAGLTTAYRLKDLTDVHLFEAKSHIGGRIFSIYVNDTLAELGAQNIANGGDAINLHKLVAECGLELVITYDPLDIYYLDHAHKKSSLRALLRNLQLTPESLQEKLDCALHGSCTMRDVLDKLFNPDDVLHKILTVMLTSYEGGAVENLSLSCMPTLQNMLLGGISAANPNENGDDPLYPTVSIKGGFSLLSQALAGMLADKVHTNMPLVSVARNADRTYCLTFKNGQQVISDSIVLAIPCSVYGDIDFQKEVIPVDRLADIKSVRYGAQAKILVPLSMDLQAGKQCANDQAFSFFGINKNIAILYHNGPSSVFDKDSVAQSYQQSYPLIQERDTRVLYGMPAIAHEELFARYKGAVGYSWPNDLYIKGSYSYIAAGQETLLTTMQDHGGEQFRALFLPIDDTLYFVGEHATINMDIPGTMEAACESAERVARRIAAQLLKAEK